MAAVPSQRHAGRSNNYGSSYGLDSQPPPDIESGRFVGTATPNSVDRLKLDETLSTFFKTAIGMGDFIQGMSLYNNLSGWMAIAYVMSFFMSFCMHLSGLSTSNGAVWRRGIIAYVSTILRMFIAAALLLFLDYSVDSVFVLLPLLLVLVLVTTLLLQTFIFHNEEEVGANWGHFNDELKLRFDLCVKVAYIAFAGLIGRAHGYARVSSRKTHGRGFVAVAPEFFLFYGLVFGLLLVLLCTVPIPINYRNRRHCVAKVYIPILAYVTLSFIILASIVAVEDILRMNVFFISCFIIIIIVAMIYFIGRNTVQRHEVSNPANSRKEQDTDISQYVLTVYFAPLFFIVMELYSIQGASALLLSRWFKYFLFLGLCSILIYTVRIVIFAEMSNEDSMDGWAISCTTYAMYGTMTITCVCFLLVLLSGELKNILSSS